MSSENSLVRFWRGDRSSYNGIAVKQVNVIYFIMDEKRIFVGDVEVSNNNQEQVDGQKNRVDVLNSLATWKFYDDVK